MMYDWDRVASRDEAEAELQHMRDEQHPPSASECELCGTITQCENLAGSTLCPVCDTRAEHSDEHEKR